jgi:hypothetical protein
MASNHLEDLVAEWYQFNGYFVRRNIQVGKRGRGGYECELDIVAFHPEKKHLAQIEPSLDSVSFEKREKKYALKFRAGRQYIPALFSGMQLPVDIEQIALLVYAGKKQRLIGGGSLLHISDFMKRIFDVLKDRPISKAAIPEQFPLLRSLQFAACYWRQKDGAL